MEGVACTVLMRVSGTPERPKPPASRVELERMSAMASAAEGRTLLMALRGREVEKRRMKENWEVVSRRKWVGRVVGVLLHTLRSDEERCLGSPGYIFGIKSASARC